MTSEFSWQNYQPLPCFILYSKAKLACYSRCFLNSYFCIPVPYNEKNIFFGVNSKGSCRSLQNCSTSASSVLALDKSMSLYKCPRQFRFKSHISLIFLSKHSISFFLHQEVREHFSVEKIKKCNGLLPDRFIEDG